MRVNANAVLRSWTLLAAFGGSYAPDIIYTHKIVRLTKRRRKAYRQQYYQANRSEALNKNKENYKPNIDNRKEAYKHRYQQEIKYYKKITMPRMLMK